MTAAADHDDPAPQAATEVSDAELLCQMLVEGFAAATRALPEALPAVDADADRKAWATLVARAALRGYGLWRSDIADGPQRFFSSRWGMVKAFASVEEVDAWLEQAGAHA